MYPGTYNFKDEDDGTSGTDIDFVDSATLHDGELIIVDEWLGHKKILRLQDDATAAEDPQFTHNETQATAGTREFYIGTNDVTESWQVRFYEDGTLLQRLIMGASKLYWYDGALQEIQAVANDILYDIKFVWRADNTFDVYVDGIKKVDNESLENNQVSGLNNVKFFALGDSTDYFYIDAWGDPDNDANYNVGDNYYWRSYQMLDDSFEGNDIGDAGVSIAWVNSVLTTAATTIEADFSVHKKFLRQVEVAGGNDYAYHYFDSQAKNGWCEFWIRASDVTGDSNWTLTEGTTAIVQVQIASSAIRYYDGNLASYVAAVAAVNNTYYHIRIEWTDAAPDTFDLWINNVFEANNIQCTNNQTSGVNRFLIQQRHASPDSCDVDAVSCSLDGEDSEKGDNRTFDYHVHSYDDITSSIANTEVDDESYKVSTAFIHVAKDAITINALHILQLYDVNSHLRFEGNHFKKTTNAGYDIHTFHSLNKSEMKHQSSYTASAEDPDAILKGVLTNVSQTDGRLNYYTEHDPTGSHSPTIINVPNIEIARRMAYHGNTYFILKPSGVCLLDTDKAPRKGAYTITNATGEIRGDPLIETINSQINKVNVYGSMDPDRGILFNGSSEDATAQGDGTGVLETTFYDGSLHSDSDCDDRAAAYRTGTGFNPQIITTTLLNVYANCGEIINIAFGPKDFTAANVYVKEVKHNLKSGISYYVFSTGIFEDWGLSMKQWTLATEGERQSGSGIYATDINTVYPFPIPGTGAAWGVAGVELNAVGDECRVWFLSGDKIDPSRAISITFSWFRGDVGGDTIHCHLFLSRLDIDTGGGVNVIKNDEAIDLDACGLAEIEHYDFTIASADVVANQLYYIKIDLQEAAKTISLNCFSVQYYIKRSIS